MKKMVLFGLFVSFCCFATELKQDVMNKIKAVGQKPKIYNCSINSNYTHDLHLINDIATKGITNAILDWLISNGKSNDITYVMSGLPTPGEEANNTLQSRINIYTQNAEIADAFLKAMDKSSLVPILFQILEEDAFGTNAFVKRYTNWDDEEDDDEVKIGSYDGQPIKEETIDLYDISYLYICESFGMYINKNWHITLNSYKNSGFNRHRFPAKCDYAYYWWYDGRKYATNIWNDFYQCWQYEQSRPASRPTVLKQLAEEIAEMGISTLPIVKNAIQGGDTTLNLVLKALAERLKIGDITNMNYLTWYSQNERKYELPPCEGLWAAKAKILDTNFVNEIDGIFNTNINSRISDAYPGFMQLYADQINCFYTNHPSVPDYWYYKLPDDVLEVDDNVVLSIDRNVTNYNPRFLTPSAE